MRRQIDQAVQARRPGASFQTGLRQEVAEETGSWQQVVGETGLWQRAAEETGLWQQAVEETDFEAEADLALVAVLAESGWARRSRLASCTLDN